MMTAAEARINKIGFALIGAIKDGRSKAMAEKLSSDDRMTLLLGAKMTEDEAKHANALAAPLGGNINLEGFEIVGASSQPMIAGCCLRT
jgi:hypothetical protein